MGGRKIGAVVILMIGLAGCGAIGQPRQTSAPLDEESRVRTAAAQTVSALGTQLASGQNPALGAATYTITPVPTRTLWPTLTFTPEPATPSPDPTSTPRPGETLPSPTTTSDAPCNLASFVGDVTIPDDSVLPPNTVFTKTWELKNTGSCAWNENYAVVFAGKGSAMSGPAAAPLPAGVEIKPGETGRVSVSMRAPNEPGSYDGYWMLRAPDDQTFGTGPNANAAFYVKIRVEQTYSFGEQWCSARWASAAGDDLPCPADENGARQSFSQLSDPTLEDNTKREGLGLLMALQPADVGWLAAHFPPVMVPAEADFRATLSCQPGADGCYVRLRVTYQVDGGEEQILGEWNEGSEGGVTEAIRDLDMLAGKPAAFTLYTNATGSPEQAKAIWFNPRIVKQ